MTLSFQKIRHGWELVLDGKVIATRITSTARADVFLIALGVILGYERMGVALTVAGELAHNLKEKGLWQQKAPHTM